MIFVFQIFLFIFVLLNLSDPKQAVEFLDKIKDKVKSNDEAKVLIMTSIGIIHLRNKEFPPVKVEMFFLTSEIFLMHNNKIIVAYL